MYTFIFSISDFKGLKCKFALRRNGLINITKSIYLKPEEKVSVTF